MTSTGRLTLALFLAASAAAWGQESPARVTFLGESLSTARLDVALEDVGSNDPRSIARAKAEIDGYLQCGLPAWYLAVFCDEAIRRCGSMLEPSFLDRETSESGLEDARVLLAELRRVRIEGRMETMFASRDGSVTYVVDRVPVPDSALIRVDRVRITLSRAAQPVGVRWTVIRSERSCGDCAGVGWQWVDRACSVCGATGWVSYETIPLPDCGEPVEPENLPAPTSPESLVLGFFRARVGLEHRVAARLAEALRAALDPAWTLLLGEAAATAPPSVRVPMIRAGFEQDEIDASVRRGWTLVTIPMSPRIEGIRHSRDRSVTIPFCAKVVSTAYGPRIAAYGHGCSVCGRTGICTICRGTGMVKPVECPTCRGSAACTACGGDGILDGRFFDSAW